MNQILIFEDNNGKKNNNSNVDIKKIVLFFCVAIIIFGAVLIINGIVGMNKNKSDDTLDHGGKTPSTQRPSTEETPKSTSTPNSNRTPNPGIRDDEEVPRIELVLSGEKVKILAVDEIEMDYIEYYWNEEEPARIYIDDDPTSIETSVNIKQGVNTLNVVAVDKAGNMQVKEQTFQGALKPEVGLALTPERDAVVISATCEDGLNKLEFTVNGGSWNRIEPSKYNYSLEDWKSIGVELEYSDDQKLVKIEYTYKLTNGENKFEVYAYNIDGFVGDAQGSATYPPAE